MPLSVLVVEHDPLLRETLLFMLDAQGYIAAGVESTARALQVLQGVRVNVLLMSLAQCDLEGPQTLRIAKTLQPTLKVIVASGSGARTSTHPAIDLVVRKPFSMEEIRDALVQVLTIKQA